MFQKQSGKFEIFSWLIGHDLVCPAHLPKICIFRQKFAIIKDKKALATLALKGYDVSFSEACAVDNNAN